MTTLPGLVTPVADLLRHPGERRHIALELRATEIDVGDAAVSRRLRARDRGGPRVAVRRDRGQPRRYEHRGEPCAGAASGPRTVSSSRAFVRCTRSRDASSRPTTRSSRSPPTRSTSVPRCTTRSRSSSRWLPCAAMPAPACARSAGSTETTPAARAGVRQHRPTLGCARRAPPASAGAVRPRPWWSLASPGPLARRIPMAVPKKKTSKAKSRSRRAVGLDAQRSGTQHVPPLRRRQAAAQRVRHLWVVQGPPSRRRRLTPTVIR